MQGYQVLEVKEEDIVEKERLAREADLCPIKVEIYYVGPSFSRRSCILMYGAPLLERWIGLSKETNFFIQFLAGLSLLSSSGRAGGSTSGSGRRPAPDQRHEHPDRGRNLGRLFLQCDCATFAPHLDHGEGADGGFYIRHLCDHHRPDPSWDDSWKPGQREKTSDAIKKLIGLQPKTARIIRGRKSNSISRLEEVTPGDIVIVRPGEKDPRGWDVLREGHSSVDESMVTGECLPVEKKAGMIRSLAQRSIRPEHSSLKRPGWERIQPLPRSFAWFRRLRELSRL